jgi:hypothetical protein
MEIKIGSTGRICSGENCGGFVKVVDDADATGGYLILTSSNPDFSPGFDDWVEDIEAVNRHFVAMGWVIDWS